MKSIFSILIFSLLFFFSCKKQKLKDEKEVFIGEWEWVMSLNQFNDKRPGCFVDTIYPNICKTLNFNKNGKVVFNNNGNIIDYKMNFRKNKTEEEPVFYQGLFEESFWCSNGGKSFMGKSNLFGANMHFGFGKEKVVHINGYINDTWMRLNTNGENLIGNFRDEPRQYIHYLKKK